MTDRPIIFSAPMVRALLDGRKTQTRRVLCEFDPDRAPPKAGPYIAGHKVATWTDREGTPWRYPGAKGAATGDCLYVREHWRTEGRLDHLAPSRMPLCKKKLHYEADGAAPDWSPRTASGRVRQGMHMPRWASRLTLTVTDVRVQRLQDISEADAVAEGAKPVHMQPGGSEGNPSDGWISYRDGFSHLWNSLHGADAWDANPWVVALTFTVQRGNIDAA